MVGNNKKKKNRGKIINSNKVNALSTKISNFPKERERERERKMEKVKVKKKKKVDRN